MKRIFLIASLLALFSLAIAQTGYVVPRVMINPGAPKVQIEPYAYVVDGEGNKYYPVMTITDNATTTSTLRLMDGNSEACIVDWTGNGDLQVISTTAETESTVIPSVVTIYSRTRTLKIFHSTNNNFYWTDVDVPVSLEYFYLFNSDSFCDISSFSGLVNLLKFYFYNTASTYTSTTLPNWDNCIIKGYDCNWTETMVDAFLADLDASSVISTGEVNLAGNNAPPSDPAGLASVASLEAKGWTVTVTAQP